MTRLIDADALNLNDLPAVYGSEGTWVTLEDVGKKIDTQPTIEAEPVRHGKWLDDGQYDNFFPHHEWRCSECGEHVLEIGAPWFNYCPNCGARMDEE